MFFFLTCIALCRPVALWHKNWIIGRWMALVCLVFFLLLVDVHCFHLLREYNPEDTVSGLFIMGLGNLVGLGFLGTQAQELIQDAKSSYNVPSWCYGLARSRSYWRFRGRLDWDQNSHPWVGSLTSIKQCRKCIYSDSILEVNLSTWPMNRSCAKNIEYYLQIYQVLIAEDLISSESFILSIHFQCRF